MSVCAWSIVFDTIIIIKHFSEQNVNNTIDKHVFYECFWAWMKCKFIGTR